ncbi:hypothetical protein [Hydrogenophaga sp. T2]|uniref:hypothetical protein n=1 Tax=Hydrogenophaga sp. T2 TaxID=3132823 RepID=UPI003CE79E83
MKTPAFLLATVQKPAGRRPRQRGQALTEFLVVALALVPLFLLMPWVARYQDVAHSTLLAARHAAFTAMARHAAGGGFEPEAQLANELRQRFFAGVDAPIRSGETPRGAPAFWQRPDGTPLVRPAEDVTLAFGPGPGGATHGEAFSAAGDGRAFPLHGALSLQSRGLYTARVQVRLADLPPGLRAYQPFDRIGLVVSRRTSLLIDGWGARDPAQVQGRLDNPLVFPGSVLRPLSGLVDPLMQAIELPGGIGAPRLGQLDFWQDVVPPDRLRQP